MLLTTEQYQEILADEAFIRRAAALDWPFMLKGSYVTRQYFADPLDRQPLDLDWVYVGGRLADHEARALFDDWATRVTEQPAADEAVFRSFRQNAFWRGIDYAMADDFPTINTDLTCGLLDAAGQPRHVLVNLDISFNLPLDLSSEPLLYRPLVGEPFLVGRATPLALQVAWKLHQTLVRPRFKDLFDLQTLLCHPDFTASKGAQALEALRHECRADGTDPGRLRYLLAGDLAPLFTEHSSAAVWNYWRHNQPAEGYHHLGLGRYGQAHSITDPARVPAELPDFVEKLRAALRHAGFAAEALPPLRPAEARRKPTAEQRRDLLTNRLGFIE